MLSSQFYLTLPEFNLGRAKLTQQHENTINFSFINLLGKQLSQCFASIWMSNIS
jgi:hypothetical protein